MISLVTLNKVIVPTMVKRGWGRVINIASAIVDNPVQIIPDCKSAKTAVVALTTSLAIALRYTGVTCNAVSPGLTLTDAARAYIEHQAAEEGWGTTWEEIEAVAAERINPALVKRLGRPSDIARSVMFLAHPDADFITGLHMRIDGGMAIYKE